MECVHHFDIPASEADYSTGICRHCGLEREFINRPPGTIRADAKERKPWSVFALSGNNGRVPYGR